MPLVTTWIGDRRFKFGVSSGSHVAAKTKDAHDIALKPAGRYMHALRDAIGSELRHCRRRVPARRSLRLRMWRVQGQGRRRRGFAAPEGDCRRASVPASGCTERTRAPMLLVVGCRTRKLRWPPSKSRWCVWPRNCAVGAEVDTKLPGVAPLAHEPFMAFSNHVHRHAMATRGENQRRHSGECL
jgi:hypothetical protein